MLKIKHFSKKALASLMLAGLCLGFVASGLRAQCPTDIYPTSTDPGYVPWSSSTYVVVISSSPDCKLFVTYCTRTVSGEVQYFIKTVAPKPGDWDGACNGLTIKGLLAAARDGLFKVASSAPCTGPGSGITTVVSIFTGQCISFISGDGVVTAKYDCANGAYCQTKCDVCHDPISGAITKTNCSTTVLGNPICDAISNVDAITYGQIESGEWGGTYNNCYFLGCDSN